MTYEELGQILFVSYLTGCFCALAFSFRGNSDTRLLIQTYLIWIACVFGVTHFIFHEPWKHWHQWWYLFNAAVSVFPCVIALFLKESLPRKPLMVLGAVGALVCLAFFVPAAIYWTWDYDLRLPGILYFASSNTVEFLEVLFLFLLSGPVLPFFIKVATHIKTWRHWPWTQHRFLHRA